MAVIASRSTKCAEGHRTQESRTLHILSEIEAFHGASRQTQLSQASFDMPDWSPLFAGMSRGSRTEAALRLVNISKYVASMQTSNATGRAPLQARE